VSASGVDFQDMIENASCGYLSLDANGRIEHANRL
jgi:sigma-B regulation protein RsbU (phosphoserine phosphatase)